MQVKAGIDAARSLLHVRAIFGNVRTKLENYGIDFGHAAMLGAWLVGHYTPQETGVIKFIVDFYRGMIGFAFAMGVILAGAAVLIDAGGQGPLAALVIIAITVGITGISAVLISINDHLSAMRRD